MANLQIVSNGDLFMRNGRLSIVDCCCGTGDCADIGETDTCLGCCNGTDVPSLTIDLNAAAATGSHPDAIFSGCSDADCQDLTGTYVADYTLPYAELDRIFQPCSIRLAPYCLWRLPYSASNSIPCESSTFGDVYYQEIFVIVGKHQTSTEWFVAVMVYLLDHLISPTGFHSAWLKSLGTTKPDCLTGVFPVTFTDADFCFPEEAEEGGFPITCDLHDGIEIVVDIA